MRAMDIAYLTSLVGKAPSHYPRRKELIEELQGIFRAANSRKYGMEYRVPIMATLDVMADVEVR